MEFKKGNRVEVIELVGIDNDTNIKIGWTGTVHYIFADLDGVKELDNIYVIFDNEVKAYFDWIYNNFDGTSYCMYAKSLKLIDKE